MRHTEPISFAALSSANVDTRPTAMGGRMTLENVPLDPRVEAKIAKREAAADRLEAAMRTEGQPRWRPFDVEVESRRITDAVFGGPSELDKAQRIRELERLRSTDYSAYMRLGPDGLSPSDEHLRLMTGVDRVKVKVKAKSAPAAELNTMIASIRKMMEELPPPRMNAMTATEVRTKQQMAIMEGAIANMKHITDERMAKMMLFGDWRDQI